MCVSAVCLRVRKSVCASACARACSVFWCVRKMMVQYLHEPRRAFSVVLLVAIVMFPTQW